MFYVIFIEFLTVFLWKSFLICCKLVENEKKFQLKANLKENPD